MTNPTTAAVKLVRRGAAEYWTQLYADSEQEESQYSTEESVDPQQQNHHLINE